MTNTIASEVPARLETLLGQLQHKLVQEDFKAAVSFMEANEYTLTFEHICEQLYAYNQPISQGIYGELADLGQLMGYADSSHWTELKPLVQ